MANKSGGDGCFLILLLAVLVGGVIVAKFHKTSQNLVKTEGGFQFKDR